MENKFKPIPVILKEHTEEIKKLNEKLERILSILIPPPAPIKEVKDPEELKADIIKTVNDAFEQAREAEVIKAEIIN